jgi:hypothetical protein
MSSTTGSGSTGYDVGDSDASSIVARSSIVPADSVVAMRVVSGGAAVGVALGVVVGLVVVAKKDFFRTILFTVDAEVAEGLSAETGVFFSMAALGLVPNGSIFSTAPPRCKPSVT